MNLTQSTCLVVFASLLMVSCEDPKLVAKRDQQKIEIARLKGELALVEERLKNLPPDVSGDLAAARSLSAQRKTEVASLEKTVSELESKKRLIEKDFEEYRTKYQIK